MANRFEYLVHISDDNGYNDIATFCEVENAIAYAEKSVRPGENYVLFAIPKNKS